MFTEVESTDCGISDLVLRLNSKGELVLSGVTPVDNAQNITSTQPAKHKNTNLSVPHFVSFHPTA